MAKNRRSRPLKFCNFGLEFRNSFQSFSDVLVLVHVPDILVPFSGCPNRIEINYRPRTSSSPDGITKGIVTCHDTIVTVVTKFTLDNITRVIQDKSI